MIFGETVELDDRRPCLVDGDQAYFHRWAEFDNIFNDLENKSHVVRRFCAVVEYLDGEISLVHAERICFTDN